MFKCIVKFLVLYGLVTLSWCNVDDNPVIRTKKGSVRGFIQKSTEDKSIYSFLSIPFAAPPVGELRFKPPQPVQEWDNVVDGTTQAPMCIQYDFFLAHDIVGQEDCLYLNVYTRKLPHDNHNPRNPVMVWIHGGGFTMGSGNPDMYGPQLLLNKDIVLVTMNYRLGPFGFMSTADEVIQGNMGMKDQNMALHWVKKNIQDFGGDPDRITIFGESAGSASVHYHLLSPMSKGLFNRAISQSGTALDNWAYMKPKHIASQTKKLASSLNCPTDSKGMLQCLQDIDARKVIEVLTKFKVWLIHPLVPFSPTTEVGGNDKFMSKSPMEVLQYGDVTDVPWMVGHCNSEGEMLSTDISGKGLLGKLNEDYLQLFPLILFYEHLTDNPDEFSRKIRKHYFDGREISEETMPELTNVMSDVFMNYWGYTAVRHHQASIKNSPIYYYQFSFMGSFSFSTLPGLGDPSRKPIGASHGDDLAYLFSMPFLPLPQGSSKLMLEKMVSWWTNFAATSNPTPPGGEEADVIWDPLEKHNFNQFHITLTPKMQTDFIFERMSFWRNLYNEMTGSNIKDEL